MGAVAKVRGCCHEWARDLSTPGTLCFALGVFGRSFCLGNFAFQNFNRSKHLSARLAKALNERGEFFHIFLGTAMANPVGFRTEARWILHDDPLTPLEC